MGGRNGPTRRTCGMDYLMMKKGGRMFGRVRLVWMAILVYNR